MACACLRECVRACVGDDMRVRMYGCARELVYVCTYVSNRINVYLVNIHTPSTVKLAKASSYWCISLQYKRKVARSLIS